jgi:CRISPR system Cascade subunit CasC
MKHLELHILQSVPVACLNRDDLNSPKTAIFGGVQRARVSSQSWKSAIREMAKTDIDQTNQFKGVRSRLFIQKLSEALVSLGEDEKASSGLSQCAGHYLAKLDPKQEGKVKTLVFLSPLEFGKIAGVLHSLQNEDKKKLIEAILAVDKEKLAKDEDNEQEEDDDVENTDVVPQKNKSEKKLSVKKFGSIVKKILSTPINEAFKGKKNVVCLPKDAADIALFGRMVANDSSLKVDAAAMFSHALSTHKVDNELDFFAAIDDLQPKEDAGAGMTGTLEFNSATYYRFTAVNLDMLKDENHLEIMISDERKNVLRTFIKATLMAMPVARKYSMNANTLPGYVIGVIREKGHPIQLVNAFEKPIKPFGGKGIFELSKDALDAEYNTLKTRWKLDEKIKSVFPGDKDEKENEFDIDQFIEKLAAYVE